MVYRRKRFGKYISFWVAIAETMPEEMCRWGWCVDGVASWDRERETSDVSMNVGIKKHGFDIWFVGENVIWTEGNEMS